MALRALAIARTIFRLAKDHKVATKADITIDWVLRTFPKLEQRFGKSRALKIARLVLKWAKRLGFGGADEFTSPQAVLKKIEDEVKKRVLNVGKKIVGGGRQRKVIKTGRQVRKKIPPKPFAKVGGQKVIQV